MKSKLFPVAITVMTILASAGLAYEALVQDEEDRPCIPPTFNTPANLFNVPFDPNVQTLEGLEPWKKWFSEKLASGGNIMDIYYSEAKRFDLADLKIQPSSVIADIGSGTGAFEMRLLERGINFSKVIAVELHHITLSFVEWSIRKAHPAAIDKFQFLQSLPDKLDLIPESVDIMLTCDTRFVDSEGGRCFTLHKGVGPTIKAMRRAMRKGGRLHVVESLWITDPNDPLPEDCAIKIWESYGLKLISKKRTGDDGNTVHWVFVKDEKRTTS